MVKIHLITIIVLKLSASEVINLLPALPSDYPVTSENATEFLKERNFTTQEFANVLTAAVNSVAWIPRIIAKTLGYMPTLVNSNDGGRVEQFVKKFRESMYNEDAKLSIEELLNKYNYACEVHNVVTEDEYVLTIHRIPSERAPVFLMHGLLGSSDDFILAGVESALAYKLADLGYDVWMGNARGNKHSRKHAAYDPTDERFWDFSWHEIGVYDLPAMIDYVLNVTEKSSVKYIGYSQGTTSFFVMLSERPEYNDKVSVMVALSPVAYIARAKSPVIRLMSPGTNMLSQFSFRTSLGVHEFLPDHSLVRILKLMICGTGSIGDVLCSNAAFLTSGYDFYQLNVTNLPVVMGHIPSGASIKQLAHYGQGIVSNDFRKYDYGEEENILRYGVAIPPSYALENILVPIAMFYSDSDWLAHPSDVKRLYKRLNSVIDLYRIPYKRFNHIDFIIAKNVTYFVYNRVCRILALN
ncbi:lipase 3-like [Spodoptera frugiperda]|uniref:Lipase 3-like n=1 Tax=Spodoptera frugiperda TaxID=7108 RepID=A0A9R0DIY8_SPOFR|nr:lipase 3-like [Spodoptera frugiperda]